MPKGYHHLTRDQRCQLYILKARKESIHSIAEALNVHRSTIYREIHRNKGELGYRYEQADRKSKARRYEASRRRIKMKGRTLLIINEKLKLQWSPQQISGWLKKSKYPKPVSHETIYKYVWFNKRIGGLLYRELRHCGKKYNKRSKGKAGRECIPGRIGIEERPKIVEDKCRLGDWELDTIIGSGRNGAIVSMVERSSKLTKLKKISRKTAQQVQEALIIKLGPMKDFVLTLTSDNGKEFMYHRKVSDSLEANFYFAKPYHSWERGLNEHTNGLVRQYIPKKQSFSNISDKQLETIELLLNNRPRKVLNYHTPLEAFDWLSKGGSIVALQN